jgi:hypothetical protein
MPAPMLVAPALVVLDDGPVPSLFRGCLMPAERDERRGQRAGERSHDRPAARRGSKTVRRIVCGVCWRAQVLGHKTSFKR